MFRKFFLFLCVGIFASLSDRAQGTYLADTAFSTDIGYGGAEASCIYSGGVTSGWTMNRAQGAWLADVFTIPADTSWIFDTVIVFGIQRYSGTVSTFLNCNLQIFNGTPGLGGTVIWGDTSTNVMVNTGFTGIYRVDTGASLGGLTGTDRPIMYLKLYLLHPPSLGPGTYWLSWSATGTLSSTSTTTSPPKVLPGRINPPGQQARQFHSGAWNYVSDNGQTEGLNMIIKASASVAGITSVNKTQPLTLGQNTPNPFNGSTKISFYTAQSGYTKLSVYNAIGQLAATLLDGDINAGEHEIAFNADILPAGVYYYRLNTLAGSETKQMLLVR